MRLENYFRSLSYSLPGLILMQTTASKSWGQKRMLGWRMFPYLDTSSALISSAASHGVSPHAPPLTEHPKIVLPFPLPVISSSTSLPSFFKITVALNIFYYY